MARRQKIQPRLDATGQRELADRLVNRIGTPVVPQSNFITPADINKIYNPEDSDPFIYGVERYFRSLRDTTEAYMTALETPESLSARGVKNLRRHSSK